jgi:hypothetical protein
MFNIGRQGATHIVNESGMSPRNRASMPRRAQPSHRKSSPASTPPTSTARCKLTVPHPKKDLPIGTVRSIQKSAGLK